MILNFANLSKDTLDRGKFGEYFAMISHFKECETCRKAKDDMVLFLDQLNSVFGKDEKSKALKIKILYSLDLLNMAEEWKNNDILLSAKGKVAEKVGESVIQRVDFDCYTDVESCENGLALDRYCEIVDVNNNRIAFGSGKVEITLIDDGKDKHSVLLIPDNIDSTPILFDLEKNVNKWQASCRCPEDDYEIVIF